LNNDYLHNPDLEGSPFIWKAGSTGILLSHGYTATTAEVRLLAKNLHDNGYTVACPLLPGHGTKPSDLNLVRWQDWVSAGERSYQQLKEHCEKIVVGGESMGAMVALHLASSHPEILGVLCYAPAIKLTLTTVDIIKLYLGAPFLSEVSRSSLDCSEKWQGYPGLPLKGSIQLLQMQKATLNRLSQIHQPILIFQGRKDTTVAADAGEIILKKVKSSLKMLYWMENSSHAITLDQELDEVTRLTVEFLKGL
jgi:carboxylesterase